jgi:hypothetical protein
MPHDTLARFVFSRAKIGRHHLWIDKFGIRGPWLSDELALALRESGLTGLDLKDEVCKGETAA